MAAQMIRDRRIGILRTSQALSKVSTPQKQVKAVVFPAPGQSNLRHSE